MSYQRLTEISEDLIKEASSYSYTRRNLLSALEQTTTKKVMILKGARGIGKSILVLQLLQRQRSNDQKVLYLSADSTLLTSTLAEFAHEFYKRGGTFLAIDEIHKYMDWQPELKTIVDAFPKLKVVVSGSSSLHLDFAAADLSRRHIMLHAKGLSFREYIEKEYQIILDPYPLVEILSVPEDIALRITNEFKERKLDLLDIFHAYLRDGYFITRNEYKEINAYYANLITSINSVIDSDLPSVYQDIDNLGTQNMKMLLKHIAVKCPFTPNISELSTSLNIAKINTLKKYLQYLHNGEVLTNLYPINKSHKDFLKPQKIFMANTNYSYAHSDNPEVGTIRETFVANCLLGKGELTAPEYGDFCLDNKWTFEVGGKSKNKKQIKGIENSYILADNILSVDHGKIPLWLLGFLW